MKFISKFSNYRVVLRPGIPGNRATGVQTVPGLYVKFESGEAEVKDEETIKLMMAHDAFGEGNTFIASPEDGKDPFFVERKNIEPAHSITEIQYGSVGKSVGDKPAVKMSEEKKKAIKEMAIDLASSLVVDMLPAAVENEMKKRDLDKVNVADKESDSVEEVPVTPLNEKLTAPAPVEDKSTIEPEVNDGKPKIVKEEAKIGGVENGAKAKVVSKKTKDLLTPVKTTVK